MAANYSVTQDAKLEVIQMLLNHMNIKMKPPNVPPPPDGFNQLGADGGDDDDADGSRQVDQQGWQAIHHAAKFGLISKLDELLYHGCDINARIRGSGNTPLHVAAINDQLQVAKVLLSHGADKTITNNSHYTAHQVAVIANNMDLAEFIASHKTAGERQQTKLDQFQAPQNSSLQRSSAVKMAQVQDASRQYANANRLSISSSAQQLAVNELATTTTNNNNKTASNFSNSQYQNNQQQIKQLSFIANRSSDSNNLILQQALRTDPQDNRLQNPLTLDVALVNGDCSSQGPLSSGPATNTSGTSQQTGQSSLLSIEPSSASSLSGLNHLNNSGGGNQLNNVQHNISPSLSQRSCGTFNTTSSGVCCDGDNSSNNSTTRQSNGTQSNGITVISISNGPKQATSCTLTKSPSLVVGQQQQQPAMVQSTFGQQPSKQRLSNDGSLCSLAAMENNNELNHHHQQQQQQSSTDEFHSGEMSESSSDELQSLMSERKPLFVGSLVRATNCYESGDPKHLQLRRDDLIEILHCPSELIGRDGQLPRLANKPMLFGRRQCDGQCGLFPSFCVRRARQKKLLGRNSRQRSMLEDVTNTSGQQILIAGRQQSQPASGGDGTGSNLPESQSTCSMLTVAANQQQYNSLASSRSGPTTTTAPVFNEFQVTLNKVNEGFGFVLRGARIDPATLTNGAGQTSPGKIAVDERLMAANKLASLQYFSDIEPKSIAHQMGLKRGDFLVSVNQHDVRLSSHEQVVQMIRQSGDQVRLRIARIAPLIETGSKTLTRVKPEPPKRDPTTTLTRNKTQRVKSMCVAPQVQQQAQNQFDADKPLPETPQSEMNSTFTGLNRSVSSNLSHFSSVNSLSSSAPFDAQSIASISTLNSIQAPDSSSSTATLTTVATNKPKAAPKPDVMKLAQNQHQELNAQAPVVKNQVLDNSPAQMFRMNYGSNLASVVADTPKPSINDLQMPPPPPPLPDFSPMKANSLKQRRASAQINQTTPALVQIDKNQLIRRRETLAVVTPTTATTTSDPATSGNGPAPICTVAAACAAAANNRLQRQQQKLQQQEKASQEEQKVTLESTVPKDLAVKTAKDQPNAKSDGPARELGPVKVDKTSPPPPPVIEPRQVVDVVPLQVGSGVNNQHRQVQSATLGWRSSAQIIQQSKPSSNSAQSQTLKISSTKQRMSILDYDSQMFVEQKKPNETRHLEAATTRHQLNRQHQQQFHHQQHLNQISNYQQPQYSAGRQQQQEQHQRQLMLRQQQQQQQQLQQQRQIQEQIRLQQQQQHRCQHGAHNPHHNSHRAQAVDNQVYLQQQPSQQYIYASQQANNNNPHHHHNHHHHDQMADVMTTPSAQQYHHQDLRHQQQHSHRHHHHHHHQQLPQHQHHHHHHNQSKFIDSFAGSSEQTGPRGFYWSAA